MLSIGGVIRSTLRGVPKDVYFQIGLLTTNLRRQIKVGFSLKT